MFLEWFIAILMGAMLILGFYQVLARTVLGDSPSWIVEAIGIMFVYAMLVAAGLGVGKGIHIGVDILITMFPPMLQKAAKVLGRLCEMGFGAVLIYVGMQMVSSNLNNLTPVMRISNSYVYFGFVVGGVVFTGNSVRSLIAEWCMGPERGGETNVARIID